MGRQCSTRRPTCASSGRHAGCVGSLRKSDGVSTSGYVSLTVSHSASASTSDCDLTIVLTTPCASRPPCRPVTRHISVCRLASLLYLCLQVSHRVNQCFRKSRSVSTIACGSRLPCRPVAANMSVCRLASLLYLCLRVSQPVYQWLRKSGSVWNIAYASLGVWHSVSAPPLLATQPVC